MCVSVVMAGDGSSLTAWLTEQVRMCDRKFVAYSIVILWYSNLHLMLDDGFNIPCVQECKVIEEGLEDIEVLRKKPSSELPPLLRRLVNDASICIYVDPEVEMY